MMTDNEIKEAKSLMWLAYQFPKIENPEGANDKLWNCINLYCTNAADLIKRQKAEIERLQKETSQTIESIRKLARDTIRDTKSEAIKEFAERLKRNHITKDDKGKIHLLIEYDEFDNLVKEMTEQ